MNIRFAMALVLGLATSSSMAAEQQSGAPGDPPAVAADSVGSQHRQLSGFAGQWRVEQSFWPSPGAEPVVEHGVAVFKMVLGGRHLEQDLQIRSSTPFQGLGFTGFDNVSRKYYASWMDTNFTDVLVLRGDFDAASNTYTFKGGMPDPAKPGASIPVRQVMRVVDPKHFSVGYFETRNGQEALVVKLEYSRIE